VGGSAATAVSVASADEALALLDEHQPTAVRLRANRSHPAGDDDAGALTVVLDRVLFAVPPADRHEAWAETIRRVLGHLENLTSLAIEEIAATPATLLQTASRSPGLTSLSCYDCAIDDAGTQAIAEHLPNLTTLTLDGNRIDATGIRAVLDALVVAGPGRLRTLSLAENPGTGALGLREMARSSDAGALMASYRWLVETDEGDKVAFGEAKLVVLGDEAVGKTSLVRALVEGERSDPNERKTEGVNHRIWVTPWAPAIDENTQLNVWDFGGTSATTGPTTSTSTSTGSSRINPRSSTSSTSR
jgi:Ras of Complex, Roc, domain of DAPkinase